MELRTLRYFLATAQEQSITRAAEQLHQTQPNLSRQLRELEDELGTTLFLRGRRISLTEQGLILRKRAEEVLDLIDKTTAEITSSIENVGGDVYIGCAETDGMRLLFRSAKKLWEKYPDIRLHIISGHEDVVAERLERGLLDFGVFMEPADLQKYEYIRLPATDRWGILMRRDAPLAEREAITPEDLFGIPLISSNQSLVRNELAGWTGGDYEKLNIVATYNLLYNASLMAEEGLGYVLCLDKIIPVTQDRPLCFRPLQPEMIAHLSMGWKKYQMFSRAAELFLEQFQTDIAGTGGLSHSTAACRSASCF